MVNQESGLEGLVSVVPIMAQDPSRQFPKKFGRKRKGGKVGSQKRKMYEGEVIVLPPNSVFEFSEGIRRESHVRQQWMVEEDENKTRNRFYSAMIRFFGGEPLAMDTYISERDGAEIGISADFVGSRLVSIPLVKPLIARKGVYFGNQRDVVMGLTSHAKNLAGAGNFRDLLRILKETIYGPGPILQRFTAKGDADEVILSLEGDCRKIELADGERSNNFDPRHLYAWDESVGVKLVPMGSLSDMLFSGTPRYYVNLNGPGRVWLSNSGYSNGYVGNVFTPPYWVHAVGSLFAKAIGVINPLK